MADVVVVGVVAAGGFGLGGQDPVSRRAGQYGVITRFCHVYRFVLSAGNGARE